MQTSNADIKFYGRRKGKALRTRRLSAYEEVLPEIEVKLPFMPAFAEGAEPRVFFPFPIKQICLEIGFGDGKHLLHQALRNPDTGFIGCEPFVNGIASLCADIRDQSVKNIRIWPDDARLFLPALKNGSIDRIFLLNSDPWPKKRHAKRRFVQKDTLDEIHRILKPGGLFRMSSDHPGLTCWQLEKTYFHSGFAWTANSADDWRSLPADMGDNTRYQKKGATQGRPTVFLDFTRI